MDGEAAARIDHVVTVDAADEQRWNEAALSRPVTGPSWRFWSYRQAAVVLGRSQRGWPVAAGSAAADRPHPLAVIDRAAGGGAVLVGPWLLGLSVVLPSGDRRLAGSVADGYRWLGEALVVALAQHGVAAVLVTPAEARRPPASLAWACFAGTTAFELVADGRKIVGFAQRRNRHGVLLVGGVLLSAVPWIRLVQALGRDAGEAEALAAMTVDAAAVRGRPLSGEDLARSVAGRLSADAVGGSARSDRASF